MHSCCQDIYDELVGITDLNISLNSSKSVSIQLCSPTNVFSVRICGVIIENEGPFRIAMDHFERSLKDVIMLLSKADVCL